MFSKWVLGLVIHAHTSFKFKRHLQFQLLAIIDEENSSLDDFFYHGPNHLWSFLLNLLMLKKFLLFFNCFVLFMSANQLIFWSSKNDLFYSTAKVFKNCTSECEGNLPVYISECMWYISYTYLICNKMILLPRDERYHFI